MSDYTQSFYLKKNNGKEVIELDFSYLIALIILAACGFLIALQLNGLFQSVNDSLVQVFSKHFKNIVSWSWLITLIITVLVISLSMLLIWLTFQLLIKNNERAREQIIKHQPKEDSDSTKRT